MQYYMDGLISAIYYITHRHKPTLPCTLERKTQPVLEKFLQSVTLRFWTTGMSISNAHSFSNNLTGPRSLKIIQTWETMCQGEGTAVALLGHACRQKCSPKSAALRSKAIILTEHSSAAFNRNSEEQIISQGKMCVSHCLQNIFKVHRPKQQLPLINSLFLLFWRLQTRHTTRGRSYKIDFFQCQARGGRFQPVSWVDATPSGAASLTTLPKCSSCKSISLWCHSTARLSQSSPSSQEFGSSSRFRKAAPQSLLSHARRNG